MSFKDGTTFNYTYDEMGNITTVCENGELVVRYTYDDLCRLVREDNKRLNKTVVFVYDNNGNILVRREYAFTLVSQATLACTTEVPVTHLYVYDGDRLISYDDQTFYYTSMSCPEVYIGKEMDWDKDGRLMACYTKDNKVISFTYDSHGRRATKSIMNGTTTLFTYSRENNLIAQSNGLSFLYDHTGVMGMKYNNATYFYRKNAQGDVLALLDQEGNVLAKYIYDAWGNHRIVDEDGVDIDENSPYNGIAQANPFRYRSYYFDTETGFYYLPARYYDPSICRFISRDDHSYLDPESINGLNLYAYCLNNPVMNFDPSGHKWYNILGWIGIGLVVVAATVLTMGAFGVAVGGAGLLGAVIHGAAVGALIGAGAGIVLGAAGGMIYDAAKGNAFGTSIWAGIQAGLGIGAIVGTIIGGAYAYFSFGNFASPSKLDAHFAKHGDEFDGLYSSAKEYAKGAKYTIRHGQKITYMYNGKATTGYIRFFGSAGKANYAFVGLNGTKTATFGIRSVSSLIEQLGITLFTL